MRNLISLVLLFCLLFSAVSCSPEQPDLPMESSSGEENDITPNVPMLPVLQSTVTFTEVYGDYIYCISFDDGMWRYNRKTKERSSACVNPTCDGSCLLEKSWMLGIAGIYDDKLYFMTNAYGKNGMDMVYASLDLITGEVKEVYRELYSDVSEVKCIVSNGYLYYLRYDLKEGGAPENSDDYDLYYYRVSIDGGEPERFCAALVEDHFKYIYFAVDDFLYMHSDNKYISYNVKTEEERVIYELPCDCYTYSYYDGRIYYIMLDDTSTEITGNTGRLGHLYSLDVNTGETKKLVDEYVMQFQVTEEGIYYQLYEDRTVYTPRDPEKSPVKVNWGVDTHFIRHDGTEERVVYQNALLNLSWVSAVGVIDGLFYGSISEFVIEEAEDMKNDRYFWNDLGTCIVDFSSGEIKPWVP